jgi:Domain of unknown function (DUF4172)
MRRLSLYLHEQGAWPGRSFDRATLAEQLTALRHHQGRLLGCMEALGFQPQQEAALQTLTQDVLKTAKSKAST